MRFIRGIITSTTAVVGRLLRFSASGRIGETVENRESFQQYGFQSNPPNGGECIINADGPVCFMVAADDRRYRISLQKGEVAIVTDEGDKIHFKRSHEILIQTSGSVKVQAGTVELGGSTGLKKLIHEDVITALSTHVHTGVTTGAGVSGTVAAGTFTEALHATSNTKAK